MREVDELQSKWKGYDNSLNSWIWKGYDNYLKNWIDKKVTMVYP